MQDSRPANLKESAGAKRRVGFESCRVRQPFSLSSLPVFLRAFPGQVLLGLGDIFLARGLCDIAE